MSRGQTGAGHSCAALPADIDPQNSVRCSPLSGPRAAIVTLSGIRLAAGDREGGGSGLRASSSLTLLFFGGVGEGFLKNLNRDRKVPLVLHAVGLRGLCSEHSGVSRSRCWAPGSAGTSPWVVAGNESLGRGLWGRAWMSCRGPSFLVGQVVLRGENESKAQPDVAAPVQTLAPIRGGGLRGQGSRTTEPEGGGALRLGGPEPGQRSSRTRSERAAAGRAGPAAEVKGRGLLGCLWGGEPAGSGASLRLKAAWRRNRGRSARRGGPLGSRAWAPGSQTLRHTDGGGGDPQREGVHEYAGLLLLGPAKFFLFVELQDLG